MPTEQSFACPQDVCVPIVRQGTVTYALMELVQSGQPGNYWALRYKAAQQPLMPTITTSDTPGIVMPTTGMGTYHAYQR